MCLWKYLHPNRQFQTRQLRRVYPPCLGQNNFGSSSQGVCYLACYMFTIGLTARYSAGTTGQRTIDTSQVPALDTTPFTAIDNMPVMVSYLNHIISRNYLGILENSYIAANPSGSPAYASRSIRAVGTAGRDEFAGSTPLSGQQSAAWTEPGGTSAAGWAQTSRCSVGYHDTSQHTARRYVEKEHESGRKIEKERGAR